MTSTIDKIIEGLTILQAAGANEIAAEHDEILVGHENLPVSEENKTRLGQLGWFIGEHESWMHYV